MDKHVLHNIIHRDNNNNSALCPVCNGKMDMEDTDCMMEEANSILARKQSAGMMYSEEEKQLVAFAELNAKKINALSDGDFAYIDSKGEKHLPINDANHVRNALARFNQTHFDSEEAKVKAKSKIDAKAKELGIGAADDKKMEEEYIFRPLVDVMTFAESSGDVPSVIKLIPIGKYNMKRYGEVNLSKEVIAEMIKHFNEGVRAGGKDAGLPIDIEHGATQYKDAAAGWIKDIFLKEDGGYGKIDWTPLGKKLLKERIYKFYSPEFFFDYTDPQHSFTMKNVMTGGGLVNKPMIKDDLPAIVNSENDKKENLTKDNNTHTIYLELTNLLQTTMKLSEIIAKPASERNSDEQKFVIDHKDELTLAEARKEGLLPTEKVQLSEGQVAVDQKKLDALVTMAEAGRDAAVKLQKAELKEEIKGLVFSEKGTKMPTDQIDVAVELAMAMSEENRKKYFEQLKSLPEVKLMEEKGTTAEVTGSAAGADLDKKAKELVNSEKITYAEAIKRVIMENPQQFAEYNENLPVAGQEK